MGAKAAHTRRPASGKWLEFILRPIIDFAIRHAFSIQEVNATTRKLFIEQANAQILRSSGKSNISRIAALTGLHRREVKKVLEVQDTSDRLQLNIPQRVIGQWENDSRFLTKAGKPRILSLSDENNEFHQLVYSVSASLNPGTILFELERTGAVERVRKGLKLSQADYRFGADPDKGLEVAGMDIESLIAAIEENIFDRQERTNAHFRTDFDNIYADALPEIREWLFDETRLFHQRVRAFLAERDADVNPRAESEDTTAGKRVIVSCHAFSDKPEN